MYGDRPGVCRFSYRRGESGVASFGVSCARIRRQQEIGTEMSVVASGGSLVPKKVEAWCAPYRYLPLTGKYLSSPESLGCVAPFIAQIIAFQEVSFGC